MDIVTKPFDVAQHLDSPEMIAGYLEAILEDGDSAEISRALGHVARAIGMSSIATGSGIARPALYKALSEQGNPTLETLTKVLKAMGLRLSVAPLADVAHA